MDRKATIFLVGFFVLFLAFLLSLSHPLFPDAPDLKIEAMKDADGRYAAKLPDGRTITRYEIKMEGAYSVHWVLSEK